MLLQIISPYFCCGIVLENGKVTAFAPIVKYMKGWSESQVTDYCNKKQWSVLKVGTPQ